MIIFSHAQDSNLPSLVQLAQASIRESCKEYTLAQREAWAQAFGQSERLAQAIQQQYFLLAMRDAELLGFASLAIDGLLDYLYVGPQAQGQGIATQLWQHLLQEAKKQNLARLYSHVSKTAQPFFEKIGFQLIQAQKNSVGREVLVNYYMEFHLNT